MSQFVEESEMYRTFNMGVGMVLVVNKENVDFVLENSDGYVIGELKEGNKGVKLQ
jgi:phosphoribosylformylglycinamidine cyclo-ligase